MTLNTKGTLLEGVRVSNGNNGFTYPPRSVVTDQVAFGAVQARAEYMVFADFANPLAPDTNPFSPTGMDIGDPNLRFLWVKNGAAVTRFDYDNFARRWNTMPGGPPDLLGTFGNSPRLIASIPDLSDSSAPYDLYAGSPARVVSFVPTIVTDPSSFGDPPAGHVEISKSDGSINFGSADLANSAYSGQKVYQTRQSFFDRTKVKGVIGQLPQSAATSYFLFLNPRPASGQVPRVRIGYRPYLTAVEVPDEASLGTPSPGTFTWSSDTGRVLLAASDVASSSEENVYYDGVVLASVALSKTVIGTVLSFPLVGGNVGVTLAADASSFVLFAEPAGQPRIFFQNVPINSASGFPTDAPAGGSVYVDAATGHLYFAPDDSSVIGTAVVSFVQTKVPIDDGVSLQVFMSGVNTSGQEQEPDFTVRYAVVGQLIQDGIGQSPFVTLPTVPVVDGTLQYSVTQGPGSTGTFNGPLVDARDPTKPGIGYFLDLDKRQLSFTSRQPVTLTLPKDQSMVKLPDAAIVPNGFLVKRNGASLTPGIDFDFNSTSGLMEFITPVGENNPANVLGVSGTFGTESFTANKPIFIPSYAGSYLLVSAGPNAGIYRIRTISSAVVAHIVGTFPSTGTGSVDVRIGAEVVADRFWSDFKPPFKKIVVRRGPTTISQTPLGVNDFSVLATTGQINLVKPAGAGEIFQVTYTSLDSPDEGVTVTPTNRTEFASFKVRQEAAATTSGSPTVTINPSGKTVDTTQPMKVYVDGVTQDPASFTFTAPGTLLLKQVITTEAVTVDYFVMEATGGETNFNLRFTPVDVDFPSVLASGTTSFNGNQTSFIVPGTPVLVDKKDLNVVATVAYDPSADVTNVTFEVPPVADSGGAPLQVSSQVSSTDFRIPESAPVDPFPKGTNTLSLAGNLPYVAGTVVTVDGDPYLVQAVKYDATANKTSLVTTAPARKNYIIPSLTKTVRPVLDPNATFNTSKPANLGYPFTLVKEGTDHGILSAGVDYDVGEGGSIALKKPLSFGDAIYALYVGRVAQPAGTVFDLNYAHGIAPNDTNGLKSQRLFSTYNLYSPDTFFFRVETVVSFIPEVLDELKKSASSGASGPNIQGKSSLKTKDFGSPSLYFDEQHLGNLDFVMARLLQFYNDLANAYEDMLSDIDGRVVGGTSGKFRFDGNLGNPFRTDYSQITNDVDDRIKLYDSIQLVSLSPFTFSEVPVTAPMWQPNNLSRIFSTAKTITVALNGSTGILNFGKTLGSLNQGSLTSAATMTTTRASARVLSVDSTGKVFTVDRNGDPATLVPQFAVGADVRIYSRFGVPDAKGKVLSASTVAPFVVTLDTAVTAGLAHIDVGSLLQDVSDSSNSLNHFYTPGRDIGINSDNGQVFNITINLPLLPNIQVPISGNELMDVPVTYANSDTTPRRIPVLDGSVLTDSGSSSAPLLFRLSELEMLGLEYAAYDFVGNGAVQVGGVTVTGATTLPSPGDVIKWLDGPNAGILSVVTTPIGISSFTLTSAIAVNLPGSDYIIQSHTPTVQDYLAKEIGVISTNVAAAPAPPAFIGPVDSELNVANSIAVSFGQAVASGTGSVSGNVITDGAANFANGVTSSCFLFVPSTANHGLYKIASFNSTSITVDPTPPYPGFSANTPTPYTVIQPWTFLSSKEFDFITGFIQQNLAYLAPTISWQGSISFFLAFARKSAILARQDQLNQFIKSIQGLLGKDDHIYDMRFLWIQQRVDRKNGTLARQTQAAAKRLEATAKLLADQQKLLVVSKLPQ